MNSMGNPQRFVCFFPRRFLRLAWVAELPGVFRERGCLPQQVLESSIEGAASLTQLDEIVGLAKRPAMSGQESLQRLFHRLLGMRDDVLEEGGCGLQLICCGAEVLRRFR